MARRHWRFVVRDRYGYTIQNAKVYVYQPGTTNAFVGTAYNAASGGASVTNPFTTNAQGEVEAWFDTDQLIDVFVTDNADAAYRAVDGASVPVSFTSFTETDSINPEAADVKDDSFVAGAAGDIGAAFANPYATVAAVAGASGKWADAAHRHPFTALVPAAPVKRRSVAGAGSSTDPSRGDHIHPFDAAAGKTAKFTTTSDVNEQLIHSLTTLANTLAAGSMFRVVLKGYQTNSTTACTYTFRVRFGGLTGTQVFSIAFVGTTTAHTDNPVHLEFLLTVQSIGATGTITCSVSGDECITTAVANTPKLVLDTQAAAVTVDTTVNQDLALTVQMNTTTGTPNLEVDNVLIEQVA